MRRLNFQVHLWVGIILTLYMIVIGVSGSVLVFRSELENLCGLKPSQRIRTREPVADIATVVENLKAAYPRSRVVSVDAPSEVDATFVAILEGPGRFKVASGPKRARFSVNFQEGAIGWTSSRSCTRACWFNAGALAECGTELALLSCCC